MFRRAFLLTQRLTWLTYWHFVLCLEGCNVNVLVPHLYKSATLKTLFGRNSTLCSIFLPVLDSAQHEEAIHYFMRLWG